MLVEHMAWYALVAVGTVESHLCACLIPSLEVKRCLGAVVSVIFFLMADLVERPLCTCLATIQR